MSDFKDEDAVQEMQDKKKPVKMQSNGKYRENPGERLLKAIRDAAKNGWRTKDDDVLRN